MPSDADRPSGPAALGATAGIGAGPYTTGAGASSGLAGRALTNSSSALDLDRDIDGADDAVEPLEDWQDLEPDEEDADDHFGVGLMLNRQYDGASVVGSPRTAAVVTRRGVTEIIVGAAQRLAKVRATASLRGPGAWRERVPFPRDLLAASAESSAC